jgi:hypothetical protein
MLAGWISVLDCLAMHSIPSGLRSSVWTLDPFWFVLERVALAENEIALLSSKLMALLVIFLKNLKMLKTQNIILQRS